MCDLRWPSLATVDLSGRPVLDVVPRGKHLLVRLAGGPPVTVHSHLRMDGSWHLQPASTRAGRPDGSADTVRAVLGTADWIAVGYRLGMLDVLPTADEERLLGHLGPDLLGPDWDRERALINLRADPTRTVGEALLDQRNLAGIGTVFMAESLFCGGVSPWTPVGRVARLGDVVDRAHRMLQVSTTRAIRSTTGDTRPGRTTWVHGRARRPCLRCRTPIKVAQLGAPPTDRVAFHCPNCQT